jgi:hypothetical protein
MVVICGKVEEDYRITSPPLVWGEGEGVQVVSYLQDYAPRALDHYLINTQVSSDHP